MGIVALTLGQAKTIAAAVAVAFVVLALLSAWVMKTIVQKVALALVLVVLAVVVWTQRGALDDCATRFRAAAAGTDTTCTFLGSDVDIPRPSPGS